MADLTEAEALFLAARENAKPTKVDPDQIYTAPSTPAIVDLEKYLYHPRRHVESVTLTEAASLAAWVTTFKGAGTALYADLASSSIVGVINGSTADEAGWNDYRASLKLRHTPDWLHWTSRDGRLMPQLEFAEHIEDGLASIQRPSPAEMLEIAQTFEAKTKVAFREANRLASGDRQLMYETETDAKAGKGSITVPEIFDLALAPYEGCDPYKVEARLRYRIAEGQLAIGYKLIRPDEVLRATFNDIVKQVEDGTGLTAYRGAPPTRP